MDFVMQPCAVVAWSTGIYASLMTGLTAAIGLGSAVTYKSPMTATTAVIAVGSDTVLLASAAIVPLDYLHRTQR